ncbi:MAG: ABC transporter substrate-binding protein [Pseudomonadota bacterium]
MKRLIMSASALALMTGVAAAQDDTFKFAFQGELRALDPYSLNETFTLGILGNVYEGLTKRDGNLQIIPGLAESWEVVNDTTWRFKLRQGVKFHNGNDLTADDVVFSANRVRSEGSDLTTRIPADAEFVAIDDHTVEVRLSAPNPILHFEWDTWAIMDKEWTEANDSVAVTSASDETASYAALNANGTGPFTIDSHEVGVKTIFKSNDAWWNAADKAYNISAVEFTPIGSDATRVAALLSGELDLVYPIPTQDIPRVNSNDGTEALTGPELRTIFLGFDQKRDELLYSSVEGKNPFKDVRVRKAFYHAINIEAIKSLIMRDLSTPASLLISPALFGLAGDFSRLEYNPDGAKALLEEAGYGDGFSVGMDCPNDRYVNDEQICQAIVGMLAQVGITVDLNAQPKSQYFAKVLQSGGYDTSFYLLGWTPGSFDSYNILVNLHGCRDDAGAGGPFNLGGYCNPDVDALAAKVLVENDPDTRSDLIKQAYTITTDEVAHIPLHQQGLAWGKASDIDVVQRADNVLMLYTVNK